jgi:hypothetical protein
LIQLPKLRVAGSNPVVRFEKAPERVFFMFGAGAAGDESPEKMMER